jgi:hypothetical protein
VYAASSTTSSPSNRIGCAASAHRSVWTSRSPPLPPPSDRAPTGTRSPRPSRAVAHALSEL